MHALVCYNTFKEGSHSQMRATMEADQISKGLQDNGFTLQKPSVNWTSDEIQVDLQQKISAIRDMCSVLFVFIMTHGSRGIVYDKNGEQLQLFRILQTMEQLKPIIPVVSNFPKLDDNEVDLLFDCIS